MSQDAVIHSLCVAVHRDRAFEVWVRHIELWWPKPGHTRSGDPGTTVCLEREAGGPGVYSGDMTRNYLLAEEEWKRDVMPEIMDGRNVADFVDPDLLARLEAELRKVAHH